MGYIYMFTSPKNKRYVGQTTRPIEERLKEHLLPSSGCKAIYGAIKKHGWENMKKEWIEIPDDELNFYEEMLVALLGTLVPCGYNLKEGGGNGKPCEEVRKKLSESRTGDKNHMFGRTGMNHPLFGIPRTDEEKQNISKSLTGRTHTDEAKQNMSTAKTDNKNPMFGRAHTDEAKQQISEKLTGRTHKDESKRKMRENTVLSKKVYQYTINGTFIQSFASGGEAARHLNRTSSSNITKCARGECQAAYGFKWSYTML
ncbi:GIY-YIG catalytic domain-containing endonuclease [Acanthocystis turfacea Chlorella virus GM0701.1]|nr:GIY-YIG catalytic domain-containing endonuclease [Acanthocystis turfacea Chlorella virus GM0701.1]